MCSIHDPDRIYSKAVGRFGNINVGGVGDAAQA